MSRSCFRTALILCALWGAFAPRNVPAAPTMLDDSTTVDRWTLPNGLEIVTRHVPGASAVSVTWGYHFGVDDDPAGRPGLASLLAEVTFTAAAGDIPERTREEMEDLRSEGWSLRVNRRHTLFTETARPEQFAGVLHQVAVRMRGVAVSDSGLRRSLSTVRSLIGDRYFGNADQMLQWQVREYARGLDKNQVVALASVKELERETPRSVQETTARVYVPANGVLALAGDFSGLDLHAAVAAEFAELPAGGRFAEASAPRLDSVTVVLRRSDVGEPLGVVGLLAPALTDSLHPSFYMAMLVLGTFAKQAWGLATPPLTTRFQYALLDDPSFARFYPRLRARGAESPLALARAYDDLVADLLDWTVPRDAYEAFRYGVLWLMGGPMGRSVLENVRHDPAALNQLSVSTAQRALWGSEEFWAEYRRRLDPLVSPDVGYWASWLRDPAHQARLLLVPKR